MLFDLYPNELKDRKSGLLNLEHHDQTIAKDDKVKHDVDYCLD